MMALLLLAEYITYCPIFSDHSLIGSSKEETEVSVGTCKEYSCGCSQTVQCFRQLLPFCVQSCTLDVI